MKNLINYSLVMLTLNSCGTVFDEKNTNSLKIIHQSKQIEGLPSIRVENTIDMLHIKIDYNKLGKDYRYYSTYKLKGKSYYEINEISDLENKIIDSVYLLSFSTMDTSFVYEYDSNRYPPMPKGLYDWNFKISNTSFGNYKLLKTSTVDVDFKEEYIFDQNFKFNTINIYHGSDTLMFGFD